MNIPYRTRRALRRIAMTILVIALIAAVVWLCWILWLDRYVVYTPEGVRLDFSSSSAEMSGEPAVPPEQETVSIYYNEGENAINTSKELTRLQGYQITAEDLEKDISAIRPKIQELEKGTAVMVDVKSIYGRFFYDSSISDKRDSDIDTAAMGELLEYLDLSGMYTIARLPAFRDYHYGLNHVNDGLPTAGGYLWMDDSSCYWLNPASQGTMTYLVQIVTELKELGFDEVLFYDFRFPATDSIVFKGDQTQALRDAAQLLVDTCATEAFTVSFTGTAAFPMPEGRSRLYISGVEAADVATVAQQTGISEPELKLVFLTELHDTRFETYGVIRPLF